MHSHHDRSTEFQKSSSRRQNRAQRGFVEERIKCRFQILASLEPCARARASESRVCLATRLLVPPFTILRPSSSSSSSSSFSSPTPPLRAASPLINLHLSPLSTVLCSPTFGSIAAADCIPRFPSSRLVRDYFISLQRFSLRLYQRPATHLHLFPIRKRICIAFRHLSRLL